MGDGTANKQTRTAATAASRGRALGGAALLAAVAALLCAGGAGGVVGGTQIDVQQAPWQVLVGQERFGRVVSLCGGAVIDPNRVVTAAHCVMTGGGSPTSASDLVVRAGISNFVSPRPTDVEQNRRVSSVRVHPGYTFTSSGSPDDVAVLYLAGPLDLSAPGVRAIPLPPPGKLYAAGQRAGFAGFGRQSPSSDADGALYWMDTEIGEPADCAGANNAIILCAASPAVAVCAGDSGSALVVDGVLAGIASTGAARCPRGGPGQYTNVAAPEVLRFIQGEDNPPAAPRRLGLGSLGYPVAMQVGQTLQCTPGRWTGDPTFVYAFFDARTGTVLQRTARQTYTLKQRDLGRRIACRVFATTAGGTGTALTDETPRAVQPAPRLRAGTAVTRPGRRIVMRVVLTGVKDVRGNARVCLRPIARVGNRTCGRTRLTGASRLTVGVPLAVKPTAPKGLLRVGVAASLSDGRTLTTVARLRVRR